jgi:hypothetical protein
LAQLGRKKFETRIEDKKKQVVKHRSLVEDDLSDENATGEGGDTFHLRLTDVTTPIQ